jgi:hypothetical protein
MGREIRIELDFRTALAKMRQLPHNAQLNTLELARTLSLRNVATLHGLVERGRLPPPTRQHTGLSHCKRNYWIVSCLRSFFLQQLSKETSA